VKGEQGDKPEGNLVGNAKRGDVADCSEEDQGEEADEENLMQV
jgi:hypothetical protein